MRISSLLTKCCDAQRLFLSSLSAYRTSLKDVLTRESDIRYILRDREILRSRLVKLSSKRPSGTDAAMDAHDRKMDEAQRELIACEDALRSEETALDGVKRRIFREALSMRMRSMAMLGTTWENAAKEAMERLDSLSSDPIAYQPQPRHESAPSESMSDLLPPSVRKSERCALLPKASRTVNHLRADEQTPSPSLPHIRHRKSLAVGRDTATKERKKTRTWSSLFLIPRHSAISARQTVTSQ